MVEDFSVWTEGGSSVIWKCEFSTRDERWRWWVRERGEYTDVWIGQNAYGSGACLKSGSGSGYAVVTSTISSAP